MKIDWPSLLAWAASEAGEAGLAGRLWGAVEAEAGRGPIAQWEAEHHVYAARVMSVTGEDFLRGLETGRRMSLEETVVCALDRQT